MNAPITPFPTPSGASRALLIGGVFDPPHLGHTRAALDARTRTLGDDAWCIFGPAARSPFKPLGAIASAVHRTQMVRLAIADAPRCAVWTDEIDRAAWETGHNAGPGFSYWIETGRRARASLPATAVLRFLIGCDQAATFHAWREPRGVLDLAEPIVMLRHEHDTPEAFRDRMAGNRYWSEDELDRWRRWALSSPAPGINSTRIRAMFREQASPESFANVLAPDVLAYIKQHHLYGA